MMLDLHIRNVAYAKAARNNHADYLAMSATVKYRILWGRKKAPTDDEAIVAAACATGGLDSCVAVPGIYS